MSLNFAVIGCGGYIAPRHLEAIKAVKGNLVAATDLNDSVGILDRYFKDVPYFREFERYQDFLSRNFGGTKKPLDYVAICSPNYLHAPHIVATLRQGASAICEKPLVLDGQDLDYLQELEQITGKRVYNILQLRLLPPLIALKKRIDQDVRNQVDVELSYITSRGPWYVESWKGVGQKSGGIATNIGVHFFDLLTWFFGEPMHTELHLNKADKMSGFIEMEKARVKWFLSSDKNDLPPATVAAGKPAFRSLTMNGEEIEFSEGFADLHNQIYKQILDGQGFGVKEARPAIELVSAIRRSDVRSAQGNAHPLFLRGRS